MQDALESIFGPGVGLIGFLVMFIMLWPKIRRRYRGFQARKRGPVDCRERLTGQRAIGIEKNISIKDEVHPDHGEMLDSMPTNWKNVLIESIVWFLPLVVTFLFVSPGNYSLRMMMLVLSAAMGLVGLVCLMHLGDRVNFYRTGMVIRLKFKKYSIDYNSIISYTERNALIPWLPSAFILHLDDGKVTVLDGLYLSGGRRVKGILKALPERIRHSDATEKLIHS